MITYLTGDAARPQVPERFKIDGPSYIVHCCNDKGAWGSGFVLALNKRSLSPREAYRAWHSVGRYQGTPFELGRILGVQLDRSTWVVNLIGQHGTVSDREHPVRYDAIYDGLSKLAERVRKDGGSIHMPRMGAGLAGGSWPVIEALIEETCHDIQVFVYDLPAPEVQ